MSYHKEVEEWFDLEKQTWSEKEDLGNGIWVYRNIIKPEHDVINVVEEYISDNSNNYDWQEAFVGYMEKIPEYRDCHDFKYGGTNGLRELDTKIDKMYSDTYDSQLNAVKNYCKKFNVGPMKYWEATNFVKYGKDQHFQAHHDHGYSYSCTISLVSYPNDDYEGGELEFTLQGLKIKPIAGDTYIFPSNFMYPHRACPVFDGIKYSMVTMLDFSKKINGNYVQGY